MSDVEEEDIHFAASRAAGPAAATTTTTTLAKVVKASAYNPRTVAWKDGVDVPYAFLCDAFADVSNVSGRLESVLRMAHCFWTIIEITPKDLLPALYLTLNKLAPDQEGIELGVGDAILTKAVADACSKTVAFVKEQYTKLGDLAEVAQNSKSGQKMLIQPKPLSIAKVFATLKSIATASGKDVQKFRSDKITVLLREAKGVEVNFAVRALQGKMRMGLAEQSVLMSLAYALFFHQATKENPKAVHDMSLEALQARLNEVGDGLRRVYHEVPSLDTLVPQFLKDGLDALKPGVITITPTVAVKPMLAHPTNGIAQVFERFDERAFTCEYKYDGERAQIHYKKGTPTFIFSRNSENNTSKYPDLIRILPEIVSQSVESFIMDTEVVAVDPDGKLCSFQVLQHRARKDVKESDVTVPVCLYAFDLLYLNGEPLLHKSLTQRRDSLMKSGLFTVIPKKFQFVTHLDSTDTAQIEEFFAKSIEDGCEGLMVKTLDDDAAYVPSKRSHSWLKVKKDYLEGAVDTLDLVPIGAYFGKGKRTGCFGGFLLACYDRDKEEYQSICKIGTGFSDEALVTLTEQLKARTAPGALAYYRYDTKDTPDVWFVESLVWEVKAADLSISPRHFAAFGKAADGKGIALRFPRFIRVREDKAPTDATDAEQVASMYKMQSLAIAKK